MLSVIHPPGQIPVLEDEFLWKDTLENRWNYGNIAGPTKVFYANRMGCPITILQWQLKRHNLRLASYSSNAEGSLRMLCDLCAKFQIMSAKTNPYLGWQGCSQCINKTTFVDSTGQVLQLVIPFITIKILVLGQITDKLPTGQIKCQNLNKKHVIMQNYIVKNV